MGSCSSLVGGRTLRMGDPASGGHQVDGARLDALDGPQAVPMIDGARKKERDGCKIDVRMRANIDPLSGPSLAGPIWSKKMNGPTMVRSLLGKVR